LEIGNRRMARTIRVGIIGDYNPDLPFHTATNQALKHAANALSVEVDFDWITTESLESESDEKALRRFDALWCSPGSPYRSLNGALHGIRFVREMGWPLIGT
jgi:CTP synthase (UTP-ammonia lyase)